MGHPEILYFSAISTALSPFFAWCLRYPAWCLRYPDEEINEGIWGYNAVLYGDIMLLWGYNAVHNAVLYGIACGMLVPVSVSGIAVLIVGTLEMLLLMGFR